MYNIRDTNISNILSNNYKSMYKGNTDTIIFNSRLSNIYTNRNGIKIRDTVHPFEYHKELYKQRIRNIL